MLSCSHMAQMREWGELYYKHMYREHTSCSNVSHFLPPLPFYLRYCGCSARVCSHLTSHSCETLLLVFLRFCILLSQHIVCVGCMVFHITMRVPINARRCVPLRWCRRFAFALQPNAMRNWRRRLVAAVWAPNRIFRVEGPASMLLDYLGALLGYLCDTYVVYSTVAVCLQ